MTRRRIDSAHAQDTPKSQAGTWFLQFSPFAYNPAAGLKSNFNRLAAERKWGDKRKKKLWGECQMEEFGNAFGNDTTKLESWQSLCREVYISNPPDSIKQCKNILGSRNVWVNLVNLIDHRNLGVPVIRFKTEQAFKKYTRNGRTFPKEKAKEEGFIKALLRKL